MIINDKRALAYVVTIDEIRPIEGYDRVEYARTNGWWVIINKADNLSVGDKCVYFEVDSKVNPLDERFAFLEKRDYRIKTIKMCKVYSQGLLIPLSNFPELGDLDVNTDVTDVLKVIYYVPADNERKANTPDPNAKYKSMAARHPKLAKQKWFRWLMRRGWGRKFLFIFFGKKKDAPKGWPTHFPGVSKTDQERCENMPFVIEEDTLWVRTEKCDGTSGTFILERKGRKKYEFYVCSRNVRMANKDQECFYGSNNYYWDAAIKYDIENKMKDYLVQHPDLSFVCWQGEICGPNIQKNPHGLSTLHLFCFHMTDDTGRYDIREAKKIWESYGMEVVPIIDESYRLPNDFEAFKDTADGYYSAEVCEGKTTQQREGYVYYNVKDPRRSFKNVSRKYLLEH